MGNTTATPSRSASSNDLTEAVPAAVLGCHRTPCLKPDHAKEWSRWHRPLVPLFIFRQSHGPEPLFRRFWKCICQSHRFRLKSSRSACFRQDGGPPPPAHSATTRHYVLRRAVSRRRPPCLPYSASIRSDGRQACGQTGEPPDESAAECADSGGDSQQSQQDRGVSGSGAESGAGGGHAFSHRLPDL